MLLTTDYFFLPSLQPGPLVRVLLSSLGLSSEVGLLNFRAS